MYLLVSSLVRDLQEVLGGGDVEFVADHEEREAEVDSLLYLMERQIRIVFLSPTVAASRLKCNRDRHSRYTNLARCLERMMDHVNNLTHFIINTPSIFPNSMRRPQFNRSRFGKNLKELMINIRTQDSHRIETARLQLKTLQTELKV